MGDSLGTFDQFGIPNRKDCLYASCYCEENIWQLCRAVKENHNEELNSFQVAFISNTGKMIPLWCQTAGDSDNDGFVVWDYHVILLRRTKECCLVYDLDTTLSFPCSFEEYYSRAIKRDEDFKEKYRRKFRIVSSSVFLDRFSSDRSHMRNGQGDWIRPPPTWPCIQNQSEPIDIRHFWSMENDTNPLSNLSVVLDTTRLFETYSQGS